MRSPRGRYTARAPCTCHCEQVRVVGTRTRRQRHTSFSQDANPPLPARPIGPDSNPSPLVPRDSLPLVPVTIPTPRGHRRCHRARLTYRAPRDTPRNSSLTTCAPLPRTFGYLLTHVAITYQETTPAFRIFDLQGPRTITVFALSRKALVLRYTNTNTQTSSYLF